MSSTSKVFLAHPKSSSPEVDRLLATSSNPDPERISEAGREAVQILVIGSNQGITRIVHSLHIHRFAEVSEWSLLLPAPIPGKLMRSLTRYVSIE
jgi:hypothetical protein